MDIAVVTIDIEGKIRGGESINPVVLIIILSRGQRRIRKGASVCNPNSSKPGKLL